MIIYMYTVKHYVGKREEKRKGVDILKQEEKIKNVYTIKIGYTVCFMFHFM